MLAVHKEKVKPEAVEALILAEIERVKAEGVGIDELNKVKNQYRLARFATGSEGEFSSLQTPLGRALALAETRCSTETRHCHSEIDRYLAVTPNRFARPQSDLRRRNGRCCFTPGKGQA